MAEFQDSQYPDDVRDIAQRLDARRPEISDLELDAVKLQAMKRVRRSAGRGRRTNSMNRRGLLAPVMMVAVLLCGTGATLALSGQFSSKQSASQKQYGPPPGCGHNHKPKPPRHGCKRKCPKAHNKRCKMNGTNGDDYMHGGRRGDTMHTGRGNDHIYARHGGRDDIHCGGGRDVVYADYNDKVAKDCEVVHRSKKPKKHKHPKKHG
jgi:hypothetical protein